MCTISRRNLPLSPVSVLISFGRKTVHYPLDSLQAWESHHNIYFIVAELCSPILFMMCLKPCLGGVSLRRARSTSQRSSFPAHNIIKTAGIDVALHELGYEMYVCYQEYHRQFPKKFRRHGVRTRRGLGSENYCTSRNAFILENKWTIHLAAISIWIPFKFCGSTVISDNRRQQYR